MNFFSDVTKIYHAEVKAMIDQVLDLDVKDKYTIHSIN